MNRNIGIVLCSQVTDTATQIVTLEKKLKEVQEEVSSVYILYLFICV